MLPDVEVFNCKQGSFLLFRTDDYISRHLRMTGEWEPALIQLSSMLLAGEEAPLVFDLGANLGAFCVPVAKALQRIGGSVYAFEPQRTIYYQLCGNIFLNSLDNVRAFNAALGEVAGDVEIPELDYAASPNIGGFALSPENSAPNIVPLASARTYPVEMRRLDDIETPRRVSLIKIDVEGYERKVIEGGAHFLARHENPPIIFEMWGTADYAPERMRLIAAFARLGYGIVQIDGMNYVAQHPQSRARIVAEVQGGRRIIRRTS